jgi:hypothetical protein
MNKHNAHLYMPTVQALMDGKTIQVDGIDTEEVSFHRPPDNYRKPETIRYRTAFFMSGYAYTSTVISEGEAKLMESSKFFIKWLTDWIEVEI